jgi:hypothetical protein
MITAVQWKNSVRRQVGKIEDFYKIANIEPHEIDASCIAIYELDRRNSVKPFTNLTGVRQYVRTIESVSKTKQAKADADKKKTRTRISTTTTAATATKTKYTNTTKSKSKPKPTKTEARTPARTKGAKGTKRKA